MPEGTQIEFILYEATAAAYLVLTALILFQAKRSRTGLLLAAGCGVTAIWAIAGAVDVASPAWNLGGRMDAVRAAVWYGFIYHLYRRALSKDDKAARIFILAGAAIVAGAAALMPLAAVPPRAAVSLWSPAVAFGLFSSLAQLLLLENLYRNTPDDLRRILRLTCIALGGLATYDVVLYADAALYHRLSGALAAGRPLVACIIVPILALAAARNRSWRVSIHVSRSAVFHSATLIISGVFLLALAAAGEIARHSSLSPGVGWIGVAQIGMAFTAIIAAATLLTSPGSRSWLRSILVDHFFTHRYDYRREWLRCIETLSGQDNGEADAAQQPAPLHTRAVRALGQLVDSAGGLLLLREDDDAALCWAGSWNLPSSTLALLPDHPLVQRLCAGAIVDLSQHQQCAVPLPAAVRQRPQPAWLAIPLRQGAGLIGCVLLAPPHAAFQLDREVFDLLRAAASEVATYLAEQQAARRLSEAHQLRDYGKRFAFVAHDIKNVSTQLSLLLSNAEVHLADPEFQCDMLTTVRASVNKIGILIQRLQTPETSRSAGTLVPVERLELLAHNARLTWNVPVLVEHDGGGDALDMEQSAFDMVVTHLLDNAIEAGAIEAGAIEAGAATDGQQPRPVRISLRRQSKRLVIDISDAGPGMTPEFVRDELFKPFRTSKPQGSGIGAFQARELLHAAGGNLVVISQPGQGTTMRLVLPLAGNAAATAA